MEHSDTLAALSKALCEFQGGMGPIAKNATNPFYKSKYASLETIREAIREPLAAAGLSVSQFPSGENELTTILLHSSGEWLASSARMTPKDATPQGQGSAITYLRRYALSAVLGLTTDEDDDGNEATKPSAPAKTGKPFEASKPAAKPAAEAARIKGQKDRIMRYLKASGLPMATKSECVNSVFELTGMMLEDGNLEAIGEELAKLSEQAE